MTFLNVFVKVLLTFERMSNICMKIQNCNSSISDLLDSGWSDSDSSSLPLVISLVTVSTGLAVIALFTTSCLVVICRRKGTGPPSGPDHWSTVTPECRPPRHGLSSNDHMIRSRHEQDRMALIAFADGMQQVTLPSYEVSGETLRVFFDSILTSACLFKIRRPFVTATSTIAETEMSTITTYFLSKAAQISNKFQTSTKPCSPEQRQQQTNLRILLELEEAL